MFCNKCGNMLPDGSKLCPFCGNKIEDIVASYLGDTAKSTTDIKVDNIYGTTTGPSKQSSKKEKKAKVRYCSRCGSVIDSDSKVCTGCGKKYFKFIRAIKRIIAIILSLIIVVVLAGSIYHNVQQWNTIQNLETKIYSKDTTINRLNDQIDYLNDELLKHKDLARFIDTYVVFVEDDGTYQYHKYECNKFNGNYFWVYNIDAAEGNGYYACPECH